MFFNVLCFFWWFQQFLAVLDCFFVLLVLFGSLWSLFFVVILYDFGQFLVVFGGSLRFWWFLVVLNGFVGSCWFLLVLGGFWWFLGVLDGSWWLYVYLGCYW